MARCSIRQPKTSPRGVFRCWRNSAKLRRNPAVRHALDYLRRTQLADGSWYGRWGMNYIYGTWSVLCGLNAAGLGPDDPMMRKAADWLIAIQNADGGWGEDGTSYKLDYRGYERRPDTASQTAWALLGLMAAGDVKDQAVARGVEFLQQTQGKDGFWQETTTRRPDFHECSICATMGIRNSFRCGRWRAIVT